MTHFARHYAWHIVTLVITLAVFFFFTQAIPPHPLALQPRPTPSTTPPVVAGLFHPPTATPAPGERNLPGETTLYDAPDGKPVATLQKATTCTLTGWYGSSGWLRVDCPGHDPWWILGSVTDTERTLQGVKDFSQ